MLHAPLVLAGSEHIPYASVNQLAADHTITAASASKAWNLPGIKCAQLILSNEADQAKWSEVGMMAEHGAANLGVIANTAAYTAGGQWLDEVLEYLDQNSRALVDLVAEFLPGVSFRRPEGTYLAWLDCRAVGLTEPAELFLQRAGVAMTDGSRCGRAGQGFVRYNFATPRPIMVQTIEQMGAALANR